MLSVVRKNSAPTDELFIFKAIAVQTPTKKVDEWTNHDKEKYMMDDCDDEVSRFESVIRLVVIFLSFLE